MNSKSNYFEIVTPIGTVFAMINGFNAIFVATEKDENGQKTESHVTVRGKTYRMHFQAELTPDGRIDAVTYNCDGKTLRMVNGEYIFKVSAVFLCEKCMPFFIKEPSDAAKVKVYDTVIPALNEWYQKNKEEIHHLWRVQYSNQQKGRLEAARKRLEGLRNQVAEVEKEIEQLEKNLQLEA